MPKRDDSKATVVVLAPKGKEAEKACRALEEAGIQCHVSKSLIDVTARLGDAIDALLLGEEALEPTDLLLLLDALGRQPPWSDIPVIILTRAGGGDRASIRALEIFGPAANVTLLERPLRIVTLVAAVKVALRARRRQREVRDLIAERDSVLSSISDAFSALDRNWRYTYVNDKVAELAGLPKEKIIGRVIWDIFPGALGGEFHERCQRAMETRERDEFEIFYKPWQRWLYTRLYPTDKGIVIFRADVTERKRQDALLSENTRRLQELEERSRLASGPSTSIRRRANYAGRIGATKSSVCRSMPKLITKHMFVGFTRKTGTSFTRQSRGFCGRAAAAGTISNIA